MSWVVYATAAAAALAAADVFVKTAARKLPNSLGTLIYGAVAFGFGLTWFAIDRARGNLEHASTAGIIYCLGRMRCVQRRRCGSVRRVQGGSAAVDHFTAGSSFRTNRRQPVRRAYLERAGYAEVPHGPMFGYDGRVLDTDAVSVVTPEDVANRLASCSTQRSAWPPSALSDLIETVQGRFRGSDRPF
jgi:hypothetical protein